ncbi:phage tail protein, partial [Lactiplantibacillus pentosus]|nr:phage tail protein [Lactiplantibacillus pentosus]
ADNIGSNGITMNSYGNIYAQPNSAWWRIGDSNGNQIVNFGIDRAGSNAIEFKRDLWVSNMGLGTAHQVRSKDGHGIYFTDNHSKRVDTYHKNIYYSGSASKSLLSEKTNVAVADVNYWSNLAMSIDLATYNYKTDDYTDPLRLSGIIDDVNTTKEWTLPEAFYARDEDGNIVGIDNGVLLNAVLALSQEQAKQIDKLNTNILALEAKING